MSLLCCNCSWVHDGEESDWYHCQQCHDRVASRQLRRLPLILERLVGLGSVHMVVRVQGQLKHAAVGEQPICVPTVICSDTFIPA